jgi:hypothetical protein
VRTAVVGIKSLVADCHIFFEEIIRQGDISRCRACVQAACAFGFVPVKFAVRNVDTSAIADEINPATEDI